MTRTPSWLLAGLLALLAGPARAGDEPAHRNPHPSFTPTPPADIARLGTEKRGPMPALSGKRLVEMREGEVFTKQLPNAGDSLRFQAMGAVDGTPAEVMAVLSDYPAKVGLFPHVKACQATWEGNLATVDMRLEIAFKTIRYRLHQRHYADLFVEWEYVHGDLIDSTGSYRLFPFDEGRRTLVVYEAASNSGSAMPDFILEMLTERSLPAVIEALREGVKRVRARPRAK